MGITRLEEKQDVTRGQKQQLNKVIWAQLRKSGCSDKATLDRILSNGDALVEVLRPAFVRLGSEMTVLDTALLKPMVKIVLPATKVAPNELGQAEYEWPGLSVDSRAQSIFRNFDGGILTAERTSACLYELRKTTVSDRICRDLSETANWRIPFASIWGTLLAHSSARRQAGSFMSATSCNLFYPQEFPHHVLWCSWFSAYRRWNIGIHPIASAHEWEAYSQIISG